MICFAQYKEYMICLISFNKFSDVVPAFTRASAISNVRSICLGINILSHISNSEGRSFPCVSFN